jgi:hypothetical protein
MPDKKNKEDFPGYPHYPAKEDILNSNNNKRVDVNVEDLSRANNLNSTDIPQDSVNDNPPPVNTFETTEETTDADVTPEEIADLQATAGENVENATGSELDIPGAEEDDKDEEIGEEDEENNYYSIGGDAHDNLEESRQV